MTDCFAATECAAGYPRTVRCKHCHAPATTQSAKKHRHRFGVLSEGDDLCTGMRLPDFRGDVSALGVERGRGRGPAKEFLQRVEVRPNCLEKRTMSDSKRG